MVAQVNVLAWIQSHQPNCTVNDLRKSCFRKSPHSLEAVLKSLEESGAIVVTKIATKGRPTTVISLRSQPDSELKSPTFDNAMLDDKPEQPISIQPLEPIRILGPGAVYELSTRFKTGDLITDKHVQQVVKLRGVAFARMDEPNKVQCNQEGCHHIWDAIDTLDFSATAVVFTEDSKLSAICHRAGRMALTYRAGDYEIDPTIVDQVRRSPSAVSPDPTDTVRCPNCQKLHSKTMLTGGVLWRTKS